MAIAKIPNRTELGKYMFPRLGYPVVQIEVTQDQIEDCISEAIEIFIETAHSGTQARVYNLQTIEGQQEYTLPYECVAVLQAWDVDQQDLATSFSSTADSLFSLRGIVARDYIKGGITKGGTLLSLELLNQFVQTLDVMFARKPTFDYNTFTKQIYLFDGSTEQKMGLLVYEQIDQDAPEHANIYDQRWVKAYAVECARYQWATNLSKYSGTLLPAGLTLDVPTMFDQANTNKERLVTELREMYEEPPDWFIG
jgi:hypothetical protein